LLHCIVLTVGALMFVSVCTDTLLYLTWMPDCGAPVRIVTHYAVEFLAVYEYMLMSLWYSGCDVCRWYDIEMNVHVECKGLIAFSWLWSFTSL
jgi:hypothetical protein